ncbi:twin-arginine translocation pathway signal sequence domain protein [Chryseobacterium hagamense]|uniref:Twin-arginine translocation pathway signal sequence domain protein n=2 Tax=Chryseobacterium hagamense TaxID=395935 RepID=A0A511YMW0_9FLAO|nr:twin-arginine translocation pathway signal sequence domain protein [Chryseobacterium hagamense]
MPDQGGAGSPETVSNKGSFTGISTPRLIVHRPKTPNGTAVLVISGGGYARIEMGKESTPTANWLQSQGVTAFELIYRLPQEGWPTTNVPFEDAQRAVRLIRSMAGRYEIDPHKIGILGFSAGGHLAGIASTLFNKKFYQQVDAVDSLSARPDFTALIYPVISMLPPNNRTHSLKSILGLHPTLSQETGFSAERQVTAGTPPTFLAQAADDPISPVANSYLMENALKKAGIPVEMHIFPTGGHGWGLGKPGNETAQWPQLFKSWTQRNGFWRE